MYCPKSFVCARILVDEFNQRFSKAVDALKFGMPWEDTFLTPFQNQQSQNT